MLALSPWIVSLLFTLGTPAVQAGCNPCICGSGGGYPPPTGCKNSLQELPVTDPSIAALPFLS